MKIPLCGSDIQGTRKFSLPILLAGSLFASSLTLQAQVNDIGEKPYLGWSTFSEQTINSNFLTQANIQAQSDALAASGLQKHGFQYINIDSGWMSTFDANGRPIPAAPQRFLTLRRSSTTSMPMARKSEFIGFRGSSNRPSTAITRFSAPLTPRSKS